MYKVLVAEDEEIIRKGIIFSVPWQKLDCTVIAEAGNGEEGVRMIREMRPDIVVTDINMPVIDGLEMIRRTKDDYEYAIIVLSGYSDFEYAQEAIRYGVTGYLLKPLRRDEMEETLVRAIEQVKMRQYLQKEQAASETWKNVSLLNELSRGGEDRLVKEIIEYIGTHYQDKVTIQAIESEVNYSERMINTRFKKSVGTTVIDYLNRYRIQRSIEYLKENALSVNEIAWKCGFGDYKYYCLVFKKYLGCSPKEYLLYIQ